MDYSTQRCVKMVFLMLMLLMTGYWLTPYKLYLPRMNVKSFNLLSFNVNRTIITTSTTRTSTTIDPAELVVERLPSPYSSNLSHSTLAVFIFHTRHFVLANLQLFLIRKLATNLLAVELFLDGPISEEMRQVADLHHAGLHSFPSRMHGSKHGPSERNANVVNWALATKGKDYLRNGTAILLLDGDVFPLTPFDSVTLLNSHDIVCRRHPARFSRYCWIGFICLAPQLYSTIDDFNVSPITRGDRGYDAGGRTIEYLLKYKNTSFSWMKETILLENDKELFWGVVDEDITWIRLSFHRCDKCGPEIFFPAFNTSNAVFYHMISGTSEWRFGDQTSRRQSIYDSVMRSPYGLNQTEKFNPSSSQLNPSIGKIHKMRLIPYHGNLTCESVCLG